MRAYNNALWYLCILVCRRIGFELVTAEVEVSRSDDQKHQPYDLTKSLVEQNIIQLDFGCVTKGRLDLPSR